MPNISSTGMRVLLVASQSLIAIELSIFSDDADPFDMANIQIGETAPTLNGHLLSWGKAAKMPATFSVAPGTIEARNLAAAFALNATQEGKESIGDVWTCTVNYPNGSNAVLGNGALVDGPPFVSGSSQGRQKTLSYGFEFGAIVSKQA